MRLGKAGCRCGGRIADSRGSVAVETALLVPMLILLLYLAVDMGYYLLAQASVHRAAASFAEVVVNEPPINAVGDSAVRAGIVASHERDRGQSWLRLVDMMIDNDGNTAGIGIIAQYCVAEGAGGNPPAPAFNLDPPLLAGDFVTACPPPFGGAACGTELDGTGLAYLRVRICYRYQQPYPDLSDFFILPERMDSNFLALRKDTRS